MSNLEKLADRYAAACGLLESERHHWENGSKEIRKLEDERNEARAALLSALTAQQEELDALRKDAERYAAVKVRHGYKIVTKLLGESGYSSAKAGAQFDEFADAAVRDVTEWQAMTQEEKDNYFQGLIDKAAMQQGAKND